MNAVRNKHPDLLEADCRWLFGVDDEMKSKLSSLCVKRSCEFMDFVLTFGRQN